MVFGRKKKNEHGLAALANATIKLARAQVVLDKTEAALERELEKEAKSVPKTKLQKVRKKGEHLIHSKHILLMVVFLNIIDCLLVLGELMLDIKYVTDLLSKEYKRSDEFIGSMKGLYPQRLGYLQQGDIEILEHQILIAHLTWGSSHGNDHASNGQHNPDNKNDIHSNTGDNLNSVSHATDSNKDVILDVVSNIPQINTTPASDSSKSHHSRRRRASGTVSSGNGTHGEHAEHAHSLEEDIAHGLHKASITILGILVAETFCKVFFLGKDMLDHKLECFDGVIVLASFIVDLVLLKGLQQFAVQDFVLILAFLVPWRIIRVVNSLVVAIMDHEHFRLKVLYKQKKKVSQELKSAKTEIKGLEACINALEIMCRDAGIPDSNIQAKLLLYRKAQNKTSAMSALAGFAMGGEMMKKQFTVATTQNEHVIVVDKADKTDRADETTEVNLPEPNVPNGHVEELAKQSVVAAYDIINPQGSPVINSLRTRSYSAIEPGQRHSHHIPSPEFVKKLAESSAGFIATMHQDGMDVRLKSSSQLDNIDEKAKKDETKEVENEESSTDTPNEGKDVNFY